MDWVFNQWDRLQKTIQTWRASSSATPSVDVPLERPEQVHKPAGRPSVEIVFFHGLQLEESNEAYFTTWLSAEGSELWLRWILKDFPDARILLVSYEQRLLDMYLTCENLVHSLTEENAHVGGDGCPVILVGHSIGCLVAKELCVTLDSTMIKREEPVQNLLQNVRGLFYYACPHQGSRLADNSADFPTGPLFEGMRTLNKEAQRRNETFCKLRPKYGWKTFGIGEARPTTLGQFTDFIVPEASARYDVDKFYTCDANHFDVCRPKCRSSSNFVHLSNFIGSVVQEVRDEHRPKMCTPEGIYGFVGHVNDIMEKLKKGVRRLGIIGMGGVGKTTLAEVVYQTISESFEYTCFLRDVKKSMENRNNVKQLRKKIIRKLCYRGCRVKDTFNWETLQGRKVLILLDDVEHESHVQVMLESDGFLDGSCMIVTSRDGGFLQREKFEYHVVEKLEREDSKNIFCLNAFGKEVVESGYEYRMEQFLKKCEGLPLALKVVGKYLYGQEQGVWDDCLKKLKHAKPLNGSKDDGLWSILRVCYESLAEDEQEMFLDVATCFHNQDLENVQQAWSVCAWASPISGLKNLQDKGLVTIKENIIIEENSLPRQERIIRMHEVLRDMGRSIACPNNTNVRAHSRLLYDLSNPLQISQLFDEGQPQVKVLIIHRCEDISIQSLHRLEELRILWLEDVHLCGPLNLLPTNLAYMKITDSRLSIQAEGSHSRSSEAPEEREKKRIRLGKHSAIQRLEINVCTLLEGSLESLGQCQALEHLEISSLSNWTAIPKSFGELRALTDLRIISCDQLESMPPSVKHLQALKHLVIQDCKKIEAIPDFQGGLQALQVLVVSCGCLKAPFNVLWQLRRLERFETISCQDWENLMDWIGQLEALQKIVIHTCIDHGFPVIDQLQLLESLERRRLLQGVEQIDLPMFCEDHALEIIAWNAKHLPSNFVGRGRARNLLIKDCENLKAIPDTLGRFQVLEDLKIVNCSSLEVLHNTVGELKALKSLSIISCKSLKSLPRAISNLQGLTYLLMSCGSSEAPPQNLQQIKAFCLEITWCCIRDWTAFLDILEQLHALQKLIICSCVDHGVPRTIDQLDFLESLTRRGLLQGIGQVDLPVFNQKQVEIIYDNSEFPSQIHRLGHAQSLLFFHCPKVEVLPDTLGELRALQKFAVAECYNLRAPPDTLGKMEALQDLKIQSCLGLNALPDSLGELRALQKFAVRYCHQLRALPDTLGKMEALQDLNIEGCDGLNALPDSLGELRALQKFAVRSCSNLRALPDTLGKMEALQDLNIESCHCLSALPDSLGELRALQKFAVAECYNLRALPDTLGKMEALQDLNIGGCDKLTALPDSLGELRALQKFAVRYCHQLRALPDTLGKMEALQDLNIEGCDGLNALPDSLGELRALQKFAVRSCHQLRALPDTLGKMEALQDLNIEGCDGLNALPDSLGELRALQKFAVRSCSNLRALPDTLGKMEALQDLNIESCHCLSALPDSLGELRALQKFAVRSCKNLRALPDTLGKMEALQDLNIESCHCLNALPDSLGELRALQKFAVRSCKNLRALPDTLGKMEALQDLNIQSCHGLRALPDTLGKMEALQDLNIQSCFGLRALSDSLGELRALRKLVIKSCRLLTLLPEGVGKLEALEQMSIQDCNRLEAVPDSIGELRALRKFVIKSCGHLKSLRWAPAQESNSLKLLHVEHCNSLEAVEIKSCRKFKFTLKELVALEYLCIEDWVSTAFPESLGELRALRTLKIKSCRHLTSLPDSLGKLEALANLYIEGCNSFEALPDSLGKLSGLKCFSVVRCNGLRALPDTLGDLSGLKKLRLEECHGLTSLPDNLEFIRISRPSVIEISSCEHLRFFPLLEWGGVDPIPTQHLGFLPPPGEWGGSDSNPL